MAQKQAHHYDAVTESFTAHARKPIEWLGSLSRAIRHEEAQDTNEDWLSQDPPLLVLYVDGSSLSREMFELLDHSGRRFSVEPSPPGRGPYAHWLLDDITSIDSLTRFIEVNEAYDEKIARKLRGGNPPPTSNHSDSDSCALHRAVEREQSCRRHRFEELSSVGRAI